MGTRRVDSALHRRLPLVVAMVAALLATLLVTGAARAAIVTLTAELTAEAEVPTPGPAGATGSAFITVDDETNEVCFELTIDGIADDDAVVAAHIHVGEAGVAGDIVVPLFTEPPTGEMTGCVPDVDPTLLGEILANPAGYYVNIHTEAYPAGAVRGQLAIEDVPAAPPCEVTVEPSTVRVGQQFTVSGNFGGAEIHLVPGANASPPEGSVPAATVPEGESFSVSFTAQAGDEGPWTVWAFIPATECGDSAALTIAAAVPNASAAPARGPLPEAMGGLLLVLALLSLYRLSHDPVRR